MEQHRQQLLSAPIPKLILAKAAPIALGIFAIQFFNLVDTFFVALLGTEPLAGLSFTFPITFCVTSLIMGLATALSSLVGRLLGAQQHQSAQRLVSDALLLTLLLICLLAAVGYYTIHPLFLWLGAELSVMPYIEQYMQVWYLSVPLLAIPMVANSAIRASGDTKTPSIVMLVAGGVNGLLDPLLIFGLGPIPAMGVKGAALASAIAWLVTLVVALYLLKFRLALLSKHLPSLNQLKKSWLSLLHIAMPASFSHLLAPLSTMLILLLLAPLGTATVAAYGLVTRIEALLLISVMAVNATIPMLVGQNVGATQPMRARSIVHHAVSLTVLTQLALAALCVAAAFFAGHLLSADQEVAELGRYYLMLVPICYGMMAVPLILAQTLNALTKPLHAMAVNLIRLFVILLPAVYWGASQYNSKLVFLAITAAHTIAGLLSLVALMKLSQRGAWWSISKAS